MFSLFSFLGFRLRAFLSHRFLFISVLFTQDFGKKKCNCIALSLYAIIQPSRFIHIFFTDAMNFRSINCRDCDVYILLFRFRLRVTLVDFTTEQKATVN